VFVNSPICDILLPLSVLQLDAVQLHGEETPEFISDLRIETDAQIIKAIRVKSARDISNIYKYGSDALLLDTFSAAERGGTGEVFDWSIAEQASEEAEIIYLAGGLTPENVADAVRMVRPYAVDVASGVESSPGKKDRKKMEAFIRNAKNA
jgi:phosphoribosylanthranilate isomerase